MNIKRFEDIVFSVTSQMNKKEKLKFYIGITEETIQKSKDLILSERAKENLDHLNNNLINVLMDEYYLVEIDINN